MSHEAGDKKHGMWGVGVGVGGIGEGSWGQVCCGVALTRFAVGPRGCVRVSQRDTLSTVSCAGSRRSACETSVRLTGEEKESVTIPAHTHTHTHTRRPCIRASHGVNRIRFSYLANVRL